MKGKSSKGCFKKGGAVKGEGFSAMKAKAEKGEKTHKAHGGMAKPRLDKRARGGKISTPGSPLSGAMPGGLPGGGKAQSKPSDKEND